MKARFYVDLYPWITDSTMPTFPLFATTSPSAKPPSAYRVAIDVDLPEPFVDAQIDAKVGTA